MSDVNPYASPQHAPDDASRPHFASTSVLGSLRRGTTLYFQCFPAVALIVLIVCAPLELFVSYQEYFVLEPDDVGGAFRLQALIDLLGGIIVTGAVTSIGLAALRGERKSSLQGLRDGLAAWPRMFGVRFLASLFILLALLLFVLPGIYVAVCLLLAETIVIAERGGVMRSLSRSQELARGHFWQLLAVGVVTVTAVLLFGMALFTPLGLFPELDHWLVSAGLGLVVDLVAPWVVLVFAAAYWAVTERERSARDAEAAGPAVDPLATM